jgi:hypothetical protein
MCERFQRCSQGLAKRSRRGSCSRVVQLDFVPLPFRSDPVANTMCARSPSPRPQVGRLLHRGRHSASLRSSTPRPVAQRDLSFGRSHRPNGQSYGGGQPCGNGAILISDTIQPGAFTMTPEDRYTAIAMECVRLAELTDNQDLRSHLQAVALDMMAEAVAGRDDHSNVIEFPRRA